MRRSIIFTSSLAALLALGVGCGDDGSTDGGADTGVDTSTPVDTGTPMDSSPPDSRPPTDGAMDSSVVLPVAECNPFAPTCGADEKCALIFWNPDADMPDDTVLFYGCTSTDSGEQALGVICDRFVNLGTDPDDVYSTNNCAEGLFCWSTLDDSFERCRALCGAEDAPDCVDEAEFCLTINGDPLIALCNPLSDCDPIAQTGCGTDEGCYGVGTTQGDLAARCFDEPTADDAGVPPPGRDDPCMFLNGCRAGHACSGEILPDGGTGDTALCRRYCEQLADGGVADGGADAAAPPGCMGAEACVGIPINADGGTSLLPSPTGLCQ